VLLLQRATRQPGHLLLLWLVRNATPISHQLLCTWMWWLHVVLWVGHNTQMLLLLLPLLRYSTQQLLLLLGCCYWHQWHALAGCAHTLLSIEPGLLLLAGCELRAARKRRSTAHAPLGRVQEGSLQRATIYVIWLHVSVTTTDRLLLAPLLPHCSGGRAQRTGASTCQVAGGRCRGHHQDAAAGRRTAAAAGCCMEPSICCTAMARWHLWAGHGQLLSHSIQLFLVTVRGRQLLLLLLLCSAACSLLPPHGCKAEQGSQLGCLLL
jgi:hypothetical protein